MKKISLFIVCFISFSFSSFSEDILNLIQPIVGDSIIKTEIQANDTILKRNGEAIICTVREIGTSEIKYTLEEYGPELLNVIKKSEIKRIAFANGKIQLFDYPSDLKENMEENSQDLFLLQKKNALKLDFISLVNNTFCLTYEKCLKPGRSLEFSLGAIGIGFAEKEDHAAGILFRGGYKLIRSPDYFIKDMRYAHVMKGPYVKFEFDFASYGIEGKRNLFENKEQYTLNKWALLIVFGNQWVFNDNLVIDVYSGFGTGRNNLNDLDWTYPYGFATLGENFPLAISMGLRFGFLFK